MLDMLVLVVAAGFVALAAVRLRRPVGDRFGYLLLASAGIGSVLALVEWTRIGDSRWLVGGLLMAAALALTLAKNTRSYAIGALAVGVFATLLFAIATATSR